jgi:hypothetical protein
VYWRRDGEAFVGYMKDRACNFVSQRSGKRIFIIDSLGLSADEIRINLGHIQAGFTLAEE